MPRTPWMLGSLAVLPALMLLPAPASRDEIQPVLVTNFPATQRVEGSVSIDEPVPQAALASLLGVEVRPLLQPTDTRHLVAGGTIETAGFSAVVLSLAAQSKGYPIHGGEIGVILVPDEEPIQRVLDERGVLQFPVGASLLVRGTGLHHSSEPVRREVAFPRYQAFFYNTTGNTAMVDLYAYLTQ